MHVNVESTAWQVQEVLVHLHCWWKQVVTKRFRTINGHTEHVMLNCWIDSSEKWWNMMTYVVICQITSSLFCYGPIIGILPISQSIQRMTPSLHQVSLNPRKDYVHQHVSMKPRGLAHGSWEYWSWAAQSNAEKLESVVRKVTQTCPTCWYEAGCEVG